MQKSVLTNKANAGNYKVKLSGKFVNLTHLTKTYWPDEKITKADLIYYYNSIHKFILPHLKDRPQSLRRNPGGIGGDGFFQKDAGDEAPSWVKSVRIYSKSSRRYVHYIICNDRATLAYLNNLGCIELNPWNSRVDKLDNPDYLVLDIDPPESVPFDQVIDAVLTCKEVLDRLKMVSFCKTSGASGMHIYIPLGARYTYDEARPLAGGIVQIANERLPNLTTTERSLKKRKGRIYLDYLQNSKGQTLASVYSARPVPGARVSTPLKWSEVKYGIQPDNFTIFNVKKRLDKVGDLFEGVLKKSNDLKKAMKKLDSIS